MVPSAGPVLGQYWPALASTGLMVACEKGHLGTATLLCERGADTLRSVDGQTPFAIASSRHGVDSPIAALLKTYPHL